MDEDVLGDEVGGLGHRQVIPLVLTGRLDGDDLVPVDLVARELRQPPVSQHIRVDGEPARCDATRSMRIESAVASAAFAGEDGELRDTEATRFGGHSDVPPNRVGKHSDVARARLSESLEALRLLSDPADLLLVALD